MEYSRDELIRVLRIAARFWWRDFAEFRLSANEMNVEAVRGMMLATCGVINSGIDDWEKPTASYFENLEREEKESLLDEALAGYQTAGAR